MPRCRQCLLCKAAPEPPTSHPSLGSLSLPLPKGIHLGVGIFTHLEVFSALAQPLIPGLLLCRVIYSPIRVAVLSYQHHPKWQKTSFRFIPGAFLARVTLYFPWIVYNDLFFLSTTRCISGRCCFSSLKIFMKAGREWKLPSPWHVFPASWSGYCAGECITR